MTKIAFLGLGVMGAAMARRLIAGGFDLTVYNRSPERSAPFAAIAKIAATPAEAAAGADIVISMLSDDDASRAAWLGERGALASVRAGAICIESSTVSLDWITAWSEAAADKGALCLDAPVTGSKTHAEAGELTFIVGGDAETLGQVQPVLNAMSKGTTHLGPIGSGAMFKLINNFVCGVQLAALGEAVTMIERSGLDRNRSIKALAAGSTGSPLVKLVAERIAAEDYTTNFQVRLMAKDLNYANQAADRLSLELATGATARAMFSAAVDAGYGDEDIAAIYKYVRDKGEP